jgi:hypothetical protein
MNNVRTPGTPAWLQDVRTSGTIQVQLQARLQSSQQDGSIMMLASDYWHTDFIAHAKHRNGSLGGLRHPPAAIDGGIWEHRHAQ